MTYCFFALKKKARIDFTNFGGLMSTIFMAEPPFIIWSRL